MKRSGLETESPLARSSQNILANYPTMAVRGWLAIHNFSRLLRHSSKIINSMAIRISACIQKQFTKWFAEMAQTFKSLHNGKEKNVITLATSWTETNAKCLSCMWFQVGGFGQMKLLWVIKFLLTIPKSRNNNLRLTNVCRHSTRFYRWIRDFEMLWKFFARGFKWAWTCVSVKFRKLWNLKTN